MSAAPKIITRDAGRAFVEIDCLPKPHLPQGRCRFRLSRSGPTTDKVGEVWGWDGNAAEPTITPSIQCQGCGLHVVITRGVENGRPAESDSP